MSVLLSTEIDLYVSTMQPQTMEGIGSKSWMEWHQRIQKLNQEAVVEASELKEESVKETLISFGKIPVLVHEVILICIWKNKILPILLRMEPNPSTTFIAYSVMYHEGVCIALLELVMFHGNSAEGLENSAPDLLDYVYGAVSQLLVLKEEGYEEEEPHEIIKHRDELAFDIGIRSLTVLRYLADYMDRIALAVTSSMYSTFDVPLLLAQLLFQKPWFKDGKQYTGGKWENWDGEALNTVEAQAWLAIRQLLLDPACLTSYDITDTRRSQLLKLQPLLSPLLLDQLSPLIELQQWLYRLAVSELPTKSNKPLLMEVILDIKTGIINSCVNKWKKIAKQQLPNIFCSDHKQLVETAQGLSEAFNCELYEKMQENSNKPTNNCSSCGKNSIQRCSRCKTQWYCSRTCQVNHWPQHKEHCLDIQNG